MSTSRKHRRGRNRVTGVKRAIAERSPLGRPRRLAVEKLEDRRLLALVISGVDPLPNVHTAPADTDVSVTFDQDVDPASVNDRSFVVHGMQTGWLVDPPNTLGVSGPTVSLDPAAPFHAGELVQATATRDVEAPVSGGLVDPFVWQFRVATEGGPGVFEEVGALGDSWSERVALGDLDGDGDLDAFVANDNYGANRVWRNDGLGIFEDTGQTMGTAFSNDVALGDLDGDGDLDAFVANGSWWVSQPNTVWRNDGTGQFTLWQSLGNSTSNAVALGDLDGDGDLDAFIANQLTAGNPPTGAANRVWENVDGLGTFVDTGQLLGDPDSGHYNSQDVALGDLDGDGDLDAFVTNWWGDNIGSPNRVWLNDGAGDFIDSGQTLGNAVSMCVALGDLNGDGHLDAFVGNYYYQPSQVWLNTGDGTAGFTPGEECLPGHHARGVDLGDFDGDGDLDVIVANELQFDKTLRNDGSAHFDLMPQELEFERSWDVATGDLDGDGDLDVFVAASYGNPNHVWLQRDLHVLVFHKDEPGQLGLYTVDHEGTYERQITDHGWYADGAAITEQLAFAEAPQDGIWTVGFFGGQQQLTDYGNAPSWSPNDDRVTFYTGTGIGTDHRIWVMDADDPTTAVQISDTPGSYPQWSSDGSLIAYHGEVNSGIWVITPGGAGETRLTTDGAYPSWSPDGTQIVYTSLSDGCVYVMDADGTDPVKISTRQGRFADWSPDGARIAFEDTEDAGGVWVVNVDGTEQREINPDGHAPDWLLNAPEAIVGGKEWLAAQQDPADGAWSDAYPIGKTGLALLKLETNAIEAGMAPIGPAYNFYTNVTEGWDYLLANAHTVAISTQAAGDPDTDGDGIGVGFWLPGSGVPVYETGIVAMALACSTTPDKVITLPGSEVDGWTYREVLQDTVDYLAWAQRDDGEGRGGWDYFPDEQSGDPGRADQSNSGYAVLGLAYAEAPAPWGFDLAVPDFVRSELDIWVTNIQDPVDGDTHDGGAIYKLPNNDRAPNVLRTGNLLHQMAWLGNTPDTPRVQDAIDYLVRHWDDTSMQGGWRPEPGRTDYWGVGEYQAMYTTMKGLEALGIRYLTSPPDPIDWYADFRDLLVAEQKLNGAWPECNHDDGERILSTSWALLALQGVIVPPPEMPDFVVPEKHEEWIDETHYSVSYTVRNNGNTTAPASDVTLIIDGTPWDTEPVPALDPNQTHSGTFDVPVLLTGQYDAVVVYADYGTDGSGTIDELNEENNSNSNFWMLPVPGRYVFYNDSFYDGDDPATNNADDGAIAPDPDTASSPELGKTALLPGQTATFQNYTSYPKGINGIMVDIVGVGDPVTLGAGDFIFRAGNDDDPDAWPLAPDPSSITVRPGEGVGGSDRVTLVWPNYDTVSPDPTTQAVAKQWLQVTVKATPNTGLAEPDVFYWGNAVGESGLGNFGGQALVNAVDSGAVRDNSHNPYIVPAPIDDFVDYDRDQWVNAVDFGFVRDNATNPTTALQLITAPPTGPAPGPEEAPAPARFERAALHGAALGELSTQPEDRVQAGVHFAELPWLDGSEASGAEGRSSRKVDPTKAAVDRLLATLT